MSTFTVDNAAAIAAERYGVQAEARELPAYVGQNFLLQLPDGSRYVLKIEPSESGEASPTLQAAALEHLARRVPDLGLPRALHDRDRALVGEVRDSSGASHPIWLLSYLEGEPLAESPHRTCKLRQSWGQCLGRLDRGLATFQHEDTHRDSYWDLRRLPRMRELVACVDDPARQRLVEATLDDWDKHIEPVLEGLRTGVIHGDGNDHNVLMSMHGGEQDIAGVVDFGDLMHSCIVFEPAIAAAYATLGQHDAVTAAADVVAGYHEAYPLTESELELMYHLVRARLCMTVCTAAAHAARGSGNAYHQVSVAPAWAALGRLHQVHPRYAHAVFRQACGWSPSMRSAAVVSWLESNAGEIGPLLHEPLADIRCRVFDLTGSPGPDAIQITTDAAAATREIFCRLEQADAEVGIGRYKEARACYTAEQFRPADGQEPRTVHLGVDGTPLQAPLPGTVHSFQDNALPLDYGPTIILEHALEGVVFYTLYGHLSPDSLEGLAVGMPVARGQEFARVGTYPGNGNWPPHVHFQITVDLLGEAGNFPGVAAASQLGVWESLCPDPNLILRYPGDFGAERL